MTLFIPFSTSKMLLHFLTCIPSDKVSSVILTFVPLYIRFHSLPLHLRLCSQLSAALIQYACVCVCTCMVFFLHGVFEGLVSVVLYLSLILENSQQFFLQIFLLLSPSEILTTPTLGLLVLVHSYWTLCLVSTVESILHFSYCV